MNWQSLKILNKNNYNPEDFFMKFYDVKEKLRIVYFLEDFFQRHETAYIYHNSEGFLDYDWGDIKKEYSFDIIISIGKAIKEMDEGEISEILIVSNKEEDRVIFEFTNFHEIHFCSRQLIDLE